MRVLAFLFLVFSLVFADPFQRALQKGGYVFVYFYSPFCSYCQKCFQVIEANRAKLVRSELLLVDINQRPDLADSLGISSVPTILVYSPYENKLLAVFTGLRGCYSAISYFH